MNRRNLIKGAAALPFVPLAAAITEPDNNIAVWNGEHICVNKLPPFQQEMWDDYHMHPFNLFILPRGGGKTWMKNVLAQSHKDKNNDKLGWVYDDPNEVALSVLVGRPFNVTIITSVNHSGILKEMVDSKQWNVRQYGYKELGIIFDEKFVDDVRKTMPTKEFDCQFNSIL